MTVAGEVDSKTCADESRASRRETNPAVGNGYI